MDPKPYMPIPDRFWEIAPDADRFMVSYPRSSSRWLMMLLADMALCLSDVDPIQIYEQKYELETSTYHSDLNVGAINWFCSDAYKLTYKRQLERPSGLNLKLRPIFRSHSLESLERTPNCRVVYLFRPPVPMLLSYIHYAKLNGYLGDNIADLEPFCISRIDEWVTHIEHAISYVKTAGECACMVRYLDEGPYSIEQLRKVVTILDIPANDNLIEQSLTRLSDFLDRLNLSGCFDYSRGSNQNYLESVPGMTSLLAETVRNRTQAVFERACRIEEAADLMGSA